MLLRRMLAAATLLVTLPALDATAQWNKAIYFTNHGSRAAWVTIYYGPNRTKILACGCAPGGGGSLTLQINESVKPFYVLREYKESKTSCANHANSQVNEGTATNETHQNL